MITVIDSIMGSGKTTYMTKLMNELHTQSLGRSFTDPEHKPTRFLYVAPLLSEVDRIKEDCRDLCFRDPQQIGRKLDHLSILIDQGANICTTHALFHLLNRDICQRLREQNYTLVIDEALDCLNLFDDLSRSDKRLLFKDHCVYVEPDTNKLRWNHRDHPAYSGEFNAVRNLCDSGNLVHYRDAVLWTFPSDFLRCFDQVYLLTYLFLGSPMSAYLRAEGLPYEMMTLKDKEHLVSWADHSDESATKEKLRSLVSVYDGPANQCGKPKGKDNPFSSTWCERMVRNDPKALTKIKATTEHWFKSVAQTKANDNAWTTFKKTRKHLTGVRYAKGFIPNNTKATNDYKHKRSLAYLCNVFHNPIIKGYFEDRGITVHEELYALSEMIQWIWRSQIRDDQPINVFIPSERMRSLFIWWLNSASVVDLIPSEQKLAS